MARYRESGVPRPQRWMALVGAARAHGSPSLAQSERGYTSVEEVPTWEQKCRLNNIYLLGSAKGRAVAWSAAPPLPRLAVETGGSR
ncbi:putative carboxylesterase 17 [Dissostichus eleginoides]|uniref:Carboxylesterase 17 n=1 Tax=Dissostichus eleginoides TaxID=100907 RepID=A0AAD9EYR7_DISEL|nr:putative carboxylesterase 17 [Dissostichus eleginoides]